MIIAKKYVVPDDCPIACIGRKEKFSQGGICFRCPILNCKTIVIRNEEGYYEEVNVLPPNDYREDWARIWSEWFEGDMSKYPDLPLKKS